MSDLALFGGTAVRKGKQPFPSWPIIGENDLRYVREAVESRRWWRVSDPSFVARFEEAFARYHDAPFALAVTNGTAALEVAVQALELDPGDEVIVPPYTFFATASCVLKNNAIPVFVDIDPNTYNLDPEKIEAAITPRTKAIIPVHFAGLPADMDRICDIAQRYNLTVIEDCAHAHGAVWKGKKVGSIGLTGCFSFQNSKNMTSGEGGIITTADERMQKLCFSYHFFGREEGRPFLEYNRLGSNYRMSELQAALLLAQLERLEEQTARRAENGAYLSKRLKEIPGIVPIESDDSRITRRAYHLYVLKYQESAFSGVSRELFLRALAEEGISMFPGYAATVYNNPVFIEKRFPITSTAAAQVDYTRTRCDIAEQAIKDTIFMVHAILLGTKDDMDDIVEAVAKIYAQADRLSSVK